MRHAAPRWLVATVLVGVLATTGAACKRSDSTAEASNGEAVPTPTRASADGNDDTSAARQGTCRDWSKFKPAGLEPLPKSPHAKTLDEVWRLVLAKHYDPTLGCVDWLAMRQRYGERVAAASSRTEAYAAINDMLGELEQSHFRLIEPDGGPDAVGPASPPMHVRWIEDQLVVVGSEAAGHLGPVPAGATLLAVDDTSVDALVERARARAPDPQSSRFAFEVARAAEAALSCERAGRTHRLKVTDPQHDHRRVIRIVECVDPQAELISLGNLENIPTTVEHYVIEGEDGSNGTKIGYLAFNVWMLPMVQRVKAALAQLRAQGIEGLVIDLRGNPGGVGPMSVPIARMLLSQPGSLGKLQFREFAQEFRVEPDPDPFTGPVALLVDEGTASTSEIFATGMQELGRVRIFGGRRSAGAALPSLIEELPGGAVLQYVVGDYHSPKGTVVEGKGVALDVTIPETRAAFAAERDPVLEAAVEHLQTQGQ